MRRSAQSLRLRSWILTVLYQAGILDRVLLPYNISRFVKEQVKSWRECGCGHQREHLFRHCSTRQRDCPPSAAPSVSSCGCCSTRSLEVWALRRDPAVKPGLRLWPAPLRTCRTLKRHQENNGQLHS